ncbi:hypothetical protein DSECCO2_532130 [anaerobic digester metagenome]
MSVPMPFMSSTMAGSILNRVGTSTEAPNMAKRCCRLNGMPWSNGTFSSTWMILLLMNCFLYG